MRRSTAFKIGGGVLIAVSVGSIVLLLSGPVHGPLPGAIYGLIGFLLYRHGMRLALKEPPPLPSVHFAVITVWLRHLVRRLRGRV